MHPVRLAVKGRDGLPPLRLCIWQSLFDATPNVAFEYDAWMLQDIRNGGKFFRMQRVNDQGLHKFTWSDAEFYSPLISAMRAASQSGHRLCFIDHDIKRDTRTMDSEPSKANEGGRKVFYGRKCRFTEVYENDIGWVSPSWKPHECNLLGASNTPSPQCGAHCAIEAIAEALRKNTGAQV